MNEEDIVTFIAKAFKEKELLRIGNRSYVNAFKYPESRFDVKDLMPNGGDPVYRHVTDPFAKVIPPSFLIFQWPLYGRIYEKKWTGQIVGGLTDAWTVIQGALDSAGERSLGFLKDGLYEMSDTLIQRNYQHLIGSGWEATILKMAEDVYEPMIQSYDYDNRSQDRLSIRDMLLNGNLSCSYGIRLRSDEAVIERVRVEDTLDSCVFLHWGGRCNWVENSILIQPPSGHGHCISAYAPENYFLNNYIAGARGSGCAGINLRNDTDRVIGNFIYDCYYGIYVPFTDYHVITGNEVQIIRRHGIFLEGDEVTIPRQTIIANNRIEKPSREADNTYHAIYLLGDPTNPIVDVLISGNMIWGVSGEGLPHTAIRLENGDYVTVSYNDVRFYGTAAIWVVAGGTRVIVKDNPGYNPVGVSATPFNNTAYTISNFGAAAGPTVANQDYTVLHTPCLIISTGGTGVSITIKDQAGTTIKTPGATCQEWLEPGWMINFGPFTVAPTVTVAFK